MLQIGRSLVRSQLVSLEFFIDIKSFRSQYVTGVDSASNRNEYQEHLLGVKAAGAQGRQPYHHPVPLSWNLGTLTSWKPLGHSRPVTGLIYLYLYLCLNGSGSLAIVPPLALILNKFSVTALFFPLFILCQSLGWRMSSLTDINESMSRVISGVNNSWAFILYWKCVRNLPAWIVISDPLTEVTVPNLVKTLCERRIFFFCSVLTVVV